MTNQQTPAKSARDTLEHEHESLDAVCHDLINRAESGDSRECDAIWDEFGRALNAHMGLEEEAILPMFEAEGPEQARQAEQIRREHYDVRRTIERLGVAVQLQGLRITDVRDLVESLRRHAAFEDGTLYAWANRVMPPFEPRLARGPKPPSDVRPA